MRKIPLILVGYEHMAEYLIYQNLNKVDRCSWLINLVCVSVVVVDRC